jgi:hypothetical protein
MIVGRMNSYAQVEAGSKSTSESGHALQGG